MSKNPKNWGKLMKTANIDRELLHIFWTVSWNSMKFSGKMYFKIILKVTKNQGFTLSLEDIFFEKPQGGSIWLPPSLSGILGLRNNFPTLKPQNIFKIWFKKQHGAFSTAISQNRHMIRIWKLFLCCRFLVQYFAQNSFWSSETVLRRSLQH